MEERLTKDEKKKLRQEEWQKKLAAEQKKKTINKLAWWVGGLAVVAFSVWFIISLVNTPTSSNTSATTLTAPGPKTTDMTYGNPKAKAVLTEYADFQCPGCGAYYPIVKQLTEQYKDKLLFVYRFFPLTNIHRNALQSAEAAYAASKQGKFWPMHDILFQNQNTWAEMPDPTETFTSYAKQVGLNIPQWQKDFNNPATEKYIKSQEQAALDLGLPGTPSFFINGKQIQNPPSLEAFKQLIDQALVKAK